MRSAVGVLLLLLSAGLALGAKTKLTVEWREEPIVIDGEITEWQGRMTYVENGGVFVALRNDDAEFVYFCLHSRDPQVNHQAVTRGLVVHLDPQGGDPFGVRFPIGMVALGAPVDGIGHQEFKALAEASLEMFELLGPGKADVQRFTVDSGTGIEMAASVSRNELAYELKVPLRSGDAHPFALGVEPGSRIALVLETADSPRGSASARPAERPSSGGNRGGTGGMGGMDGGMGDVERLPSDGRSFELSLKVKAKVNLASDPS
jgi:hypothetical protein